MSTDVLARLTPERLRALSALLERTERPPDAAFLRVTGTVPDELVDAVSDRVRALFDGLGSPRAIAAALRLLADDRERERKAAPRIEVVWSGPEGQAPRHRSTLAVVQQLFETAGHRLLLSTYAIDVDHRAGELFRGLAKRMEREPALDVELFVNVPPPRAGETPADAVAAFRQKFRERIWPWNRLPRVWFDPRAQKGEARAVLHAKCVIADGREALVTSANFTEAAQGRNVELGLYVRGESVARGIEAPFYALVSAGLVRKLFA